MVITRMFAFVENIGLEAYLMWASALQPAFVWGLLGLGAAADGLSSGKVWDTWSGPCHTQYHLWVRPLTSVIMAPGHVQGLFPK